MPINNECRDSLGYVMADAMGFDLFAFVFWGAERSQRWFEVGPIKSSKTPFAGLR